MPALATAVLDARIQHTMMLYSFVQTFSSYSNASEHIRWVQEAVELCRPSTWPTAIRSCAAAQMPASVLVSIQVLYEAVKGLEEVGAGSPALRAALLRGVGVHHSGLDTKFRQAVEMLFRSKHLQVM
jgi:hypothetical protein